MKYTHLIVKGAYLSINEHVTHFVPNIRHKASFKLPIARGKFLSIKNQRGLDSDYYFQQWVTNVRSHNNNTDHTTITQITRLNAIPESRNRIV